MLTKLVEYNSCLLTLYIILVLAIKWLSIILHKHKHKHTIKIKCSHIHEVHYICESICNYILNKFYCIMKKHFMRVSSTINRLHYKGPVCEMYRDYTKSTYTRCVQKVYSLVMSIPSLLTRLLKSNTYVYGILNT